jgi:hypothetical protein
LRAGQGPQLPEAEAEAEAEAAAEAAAEAEAEAEAEPPPRRCRASGYKELIIGAGGENVAPVPMENFLKTNGFGISDAMMVGDRQK